MIFSHFLSKIYITYTKFTMYILLKKWQKVSKIFVVNRSHLFGGPVAGSGRFGSLFLKNQNQKIKNRNEIGKKGSNIRFFSCVQEKKLPHGHLML